jgi:hypothetical protein
MRAGSGHPYPTFNAIGFLASLTSLLPLPLVGQEKLCACLAALFCSLTSLRNSGVPILLQELVFWWMMHASWRVKGGRSVFLPLTCTRATLRRQKGGTVMATVSNVLEGDPIEMLFERGATDGLPVVPPTRERVERMLAGAPDRQRDELIGSIGPCYGEATVEKVAINAVMTRSLKR